MPALRDRPGDAALLAEAFVRRLASQHPGGPHRIATESLPLLEHHPWPGNVRELANVVQREFLLTDGDCLQLTRGSFGLAQPALAPDAMPGSFRRARDEALAAFERLFLRRALTESGGNVSLAAQRAGKERRSFGRLLKKHGIDRTDYLHP
jgi:DNA-binding NtrC family response regulator